MSYIDKVLGIAGMGSTIANVSLLKRFLSGVTTVIALTAISSTMAGMLLLTAIYGLYLGLIHYGLEPVAAVVAMGSLALIITAILAWMAVMRWRELRELPHIMTHGPLMGQVNRIADAFVDGLLSRRHNDR